MAALLKRFFPVVHCVCPLEKQGSGHALRNARIAFENFADGVFLIGHALNYQSLLMIYEQVRKEFPENWIGVNFLDVAARKDWSLLMQLARRYPDVNALWIDNMPDTRLDTNARIELFGGVAFKYIDPNLRGEALVAECHRAKRLVDVITTSGSATGSPPDIAKLEEMRSAIGDQTRLALASGVTIENVGEFLPTVDTFLVASSVTRREKNLGNREYLIPERVMFLATEIHRQVDE